jgi:hypothetical protein
MVHYERNLDLHKLHESLASASHRDHLLPEEDTKFGWARLSDPLQQGPDVVADDIKLEIAVNILF